MMLPFLLVLLVLCFQGAKCSRATDPEFCKQLKEVVFLLDASRSVHQPDFEKLINFTQTMIDNLDLRPNSTRVAVILFGLDAEVKVGFDDYETKEELKTQVGQIQHLNGGQTDTHKGLEKAREILSPSNDSVTQIILCVTDGNPTSKQKVTQEVATLKNLGVHILAIGVGHKIRTKGLEILASEHNDNYIHSVGDYGRLNNLVEDLSWHLCSAEAEGLSDVDALGCTNNMTELVIILDSSNSMDDPDFQATKTFSRDLINALNMGPELTQVALLIYGTSTRMVSHLNPNTDEVLQSLNNLNHGTLGNTHTEHALEDAGYELRRGNETREYASRHIVVIFSDGFYQHTYKTQTEVEDLIGKGVYIFGVGVGQGVEVKVTELTSQNRVETEHQFYYGIDQDNAASLMAAEIGRLPCQEITV